LPFAALRTRDAVYNKSIAVAKAVSGESGVLDAEAYVEGTVNDRSERSNAAPGFMNSGSEILRVEKSRNC
jgi:hypothetical protein